MVWSEKFRKSEMSLDTGVDIKVCAGANQSL